MSFEVYWLSFLRKSLLSSCPLRIIWWMKFGRGNRGFQKTKWIFKINEFQNWNWKKKSLYRYNKRKELKEKGQAPKAIQTYDLQNRARSTTWAYISPRWCCCWARYRVCWCSYGYLILITRVDVTEWKWFTCPLPRPWHWNYQWYKHL